MFLSAEAEKRMKDIGLSVPETTMVKHAILGKEFDPTQPEAYLKSFAIKRVKGESLSHDTRLSRYRWR